MTTCKLVTYNCLQNPTTATIWKFSRSSTEFQTQQKHNHLIITITALTKIRTMFFQTFYFNQWNLEKIFSMVMLVLRLLPMVVSELPLRDLERYKYDPLIPNKLIFCQDSRQRPPTILRVSLYTFSYLMDLTRFH